MQNKKNRYLEYFFGFIARAKYWDIEILNIENTGIVNVGNRHLPLELPIKICSFFSYTTCKKIKN